MATSRMIIAKEIAAESKANTRLTEAQVNYVITAFLAKIVDYSNTEGHVSIKRFGRFRVVERKAKHCKTPQGIYCETKAQKTLVFKPSNAIIKKYNS